MACAFMGEVSSDGAWYGVRVKPRSEFKASEELSVQGFEAFLPVRRVRRRWSDRVKVLAAPLFPGYLFCQFHTVNRSRVLRTPGVAYILGYGRTPTPVSEREVRSIRRLVESGMVLVDYPYLQAGQRVRIERGPLTGVEGIIVKAENGKARVVVSVTLLQRAVATELDRDWIGSDE